MSVVDFTLIDHGNNRPSIPCRARQNLSRERRHDTTGHGTGGMACNASTRSRSTVNRTIGLAND